MLFSTLFVSFVSLVSVLPFSVQALPIVARDSSPNQGGIATFFYQNGNPGACGRTHSDDDMVVAVPQGRYSGSDCGKKVHITNEDTGKTIVATVADECPGCQNTNSLDMSLGAFQAMGGQKAKGTYNISWKFMDD